MKIVHAVQELGASMIEIKPLSPVFGEVNVPGSKSYTHRIFIASALSNGICTIKNALRSDDTMLTMNALKQMGVGIEEDEHHTIIHGTHGKLAPTAEAIYLGNSGTSMRLLTAVAALVPGKTVLTGTERMKERPIKDLLAGLVQLGIPVQALNANGCPPIEISGGILKGGQANLNCSISSQFLSALLLIAPYTQEGIEIHVTEGPVSKPYIDMTVEVMERLGVEVIRSGYERFRVSGKQIYAAGDYPVEPDCSQASYFWASAAITGGSVKVKGIHTRSKQGDIRLLERFRQMGCTITPEEDGITVTGGKLTAIETDMADLPDMVPTLGVVAAFADGITVIKNVAHLKAKESDRLAAVANELTKMGIRVTCTDSGLLIEGGKPHGAEIETYNDHRIAMSFAAAGLKVPGIVIRNPSCVEKSFPKFWDVFQKLSNV